MMTTQPAKPIQPGGTTGADIGRSSKPFEPISGYGAVLFAGAIFGFFYAWSSSAMIGFDSADPRVAIAAMQAVNDSVRNVFFFPAFFLTPVVAGIAAAMHWSQNRTAAKLFLAGGLVYFFGGMVLTAVIHIPLNNDLGLLAVPTDVAEAQAIWDDYTGQWQFWNAVRTVFSGLSLLLCAAGLRAGRW